MDSLSDVEVARGHGVTESLGSAQPLEVALTGRATPMAVVHGASDAHAPATTGMQRALVTTIASVVIDVSAVALGYVLTKAIRADNWDLDASGLFRPVSGVIFATVPIWLLVFAVYGLYDLRRPTHITAEVQRLFHAVAMSVLVVVLVTFAARIDISRSFIGALLVMCLATTMFGRLLMRRVRHALNARSLTSQPTLVVGGNDEARAIARTLRRRRWMGYEVRGFIDVSASGRHTIDGLPVLGVVDDIGKIAAEYGIAAVIVAGTAAGGGTLQLVDSTLSANVAVRVSPGLPNLGAARVVMEPIDGMALFSLRRHLFSRRQRAVKRVLDVAVAGATLVIVSPVMAVLAVLVRASSPGPILFRQHRIGVDGRAFVMYKFRTMVAGAETQQDFLESINEADGLLFKIRGDPRVTRVGRVLRRFSLDELPQLFNVLKGEMSLVGPRPALPAETAAYDDRWRGRLRVKPGVTGLWQINGRHDLVFEDYIRYDLFYVDNWSLTMDLYILAKTLPALINGHGSF